ncbi:Glucan 1,3-beta-glucosidase 3 [Tilletia horrida]|nr:Glucan 1,3-beta-glucosidase 3 [Tilletia horrida]
MQIFPRDAQSLFKIANSLSLAVANYKPIPIVPPTGTLAVNGTNAITGLNGSNGTFAVNGTTSSIAIPNRFQVLGGNATSSTSNAATEQSLVNPAANVSEWGIPSTLNLDTSTASPLHLAAQATIGPGNCPVQTTPYVPIGGWEALPAPIFAPFDPVRANIMRYRQQQGVNLGSWFAQENWMEWSLFSCSINGKAGELDLLGGWGTTPDGVANATAFLEKHWDTWVREDDFAKLAAIGINTVRIPIGHWSVGPYYAENSKFEPWKDVYQFSWRYIARAINWAAKYDIGVILDMHGAYGSQNGQSHSGISDGSVEFFTPDNMNRTTDLLVWLAHEISDVTNVVGIQLLNEPKDRTALWTWYNSTMDAMRNASSYAQTMPLYFHDAFKLEKGAQFVANRTDFVVQDHHSYYVYTPSDIALSAKAHIRQINGRISDWMSGQSDIARRNLIVGEWSCALADNSKDQSDNPEAAQRTFCEAQRDVYSSVSAGWTFWSYKMENCDKNPGWCFQSAVNKYLPRTFDSWGLGNVAPLLYNASSVEAQNASSNILAALRDIQLPAKALQLFRSGNSTQEQDEADGIATTFENDTQSGPQSTTTSSTSKSLTATSSAATASSSTSSSSTSTSATNVFTATTSASATMSTATATSSSTTDSSSSSTSSTSSTDAATSTSTAAGSSSSTSSPATTGSSSSSVSASSTAAAEKVFSTSNSSASSASSSASASTTATAEKVLSTPKSLITRPFIGKVIPSNDDPSSSSSYADESNIASRRRRAVSSSASLRRRGTGSLAGRAAALVIRDREVLRKRQAAQTALVQKSGYSDGFMSAKIFASSIGLSRIGFTEQYINDSWTARVASGKIPASFSKADVNNYKKQFRSGLSDAEGAIISAVKTTLATPAGAVIGSSSGTGSSSS